MTSSKDNFVGHSGGATNETLNEDLRKLLEDLDQNRDAQQLQRLSPASKAAYKETLSCGLKSLLGTISLANNETWNDAMTYGRDVILSPQDTEQRASAFWTRSCSDIYHALVKRFGPSTIAAAKSGSISILQNEFNGDKRAVPHVNKKASYLRHRGSSQLGAIYYPQTHILAAACFECTMMACSLAISSFLPVEKAIPAAYLSHVGACDDYGKFTEEDYDVRMRLVALSAGVAYQQAGKIPSVFVDATALQAQGEGTENLLSVEAAMAWRSVSGSATACSAYNFGIRGCDLEEGLIMPISMMVMHDLLDWRNDVAASNHENGVTAVYGFGIEKPFHTYLEALLEKIQDSPRYGVYGIGGIMYIHFTASRYGAWSYKGKHGRACEKCVQLLRSATEGAGLEWAPKAPPKSYEEGDRMRERGRRWADEFIDGGLMQELVSWFQYLVSSGKIWLFDALADGVEPVDEDTEWV